MSDLAESEQTPLLDAFRAAAAERQIGFELGDDPTVVLTRVVMNMPFCRGGDTTAEVLLREWRGTSQSKHYLLQALLAEVGVEAWVVHRRATLTPDAAAELLGERVAAAIPADGMTLIHTTLTVERDGVWVPLDASLPGAWDGSFPMPVACGPGEDYTVPLDGNPELLLSGLSIMFCDPEATEAVLTALEETYGQPTR